MSKILLASSVLALAAASVLLPVGCSAPSSEEPSGSATSYLEADGAPPARGVLAISQVYTGGADDSPFQKDYVELINRSKNAVDLEGLSLQYAADTAAFGAAIIPLTGTIAPGGYFLVALGPEAPAAGTPLPTPDLVTTGAAAVDLATANGKIALAPSTNGLNCGSGTPCGNSALDLVGYGAVTDREGTAVPALAADKAALRKGNGCTDANDNRADFTVGAPAPRSKASPATECAATPPRDGGGPATPFKDPELGDESPFDAGTRRDGGNALGSGSGSSSSCSSSLPVTSGSASAFGLLFAVGLASLRRRRR